MLDTQAERLIERLKNACTYHRFDESGVHAEYMRFLMRYDFDRMNEAIDAAIEEDSRNVPPISALVKKYRELKESSKGRTNVQNEEYCAICDDRGFILMKKKDKESGFLYEYVLYCPFCQVGRSFAYDGSRCKDRKSSYRVPPLTEFFGDEGIQALREDNLKRKSERTKATRIEREKLQSVGKSIPDGWQYDMTEDLPF